MKSLQDSTLYRRCANLLKVTFLHLEAGCRGLVLLYILLSFKIRLVDILVRHCDFVLLIIQFNPCYIFMLTEEQLSFY
jgi:hypothetical protein